MKAIILARVSTKEQEEGHSIAAQRLRLVDYCARKGLKVIKTYELVESSTRGERGCARDVQTAESAAAYPRPVHKSFGRAAT